MINRIIRFIMKRIFLSVLLLISVSFAFGQDVVGYWKGTLEFMGQKIELAFDISSNGGTLSATMDAQGIPGLPVSSVVFEDNVLKLELTQFNIAVEGICSEGKIEGKYHQNGIELPLTLVRGEKSAPRRPQEPREPFPYLTEEVKFHNSEENFDLAGTLTIPEGNGPFTALVLVTGSGAQNRDEELMGHRPFAVIADYLTRQGIAVLRYDDRGVGASGDGKQGATTADIANDASAAVDYLRSRKDIASVGLAGHSEGGAIAFMLASRGKLDFIISLAGPAMKGSDVLASQQEAIYRASGMTDAAIKDNEKLFIAIFKAVDSASTPEEALAGVKAAAAGLPDDRKQAIIDQMLNPWMFFFAKYNPTEDLSYIKCPLLAINGSADLQVISSDNLKALTTIAKANPSLSIKMVELPGLNHLFQHCKSGLPAEYGTIEETFAPEALELMLSFIREQTSK